MGTRQQYEDWSQKFNRLYVGVSLISVQFRRAEVEHIPIKKMILESDSSAQKKIKTMNDKARGLQLRHFDISNPYYVEWVADRLEQIKFITSTSVIRITLYNAWKVFLRKPTAGDDVDYAIVVPPKL